MPTSARALSTRSRLVVAALHDAEQRAAGRRALESARLQRSAQRSDSRIARAISAGSRRQREAFVELHRDVGAEQRLDLDRALGRELDDGAVEMRAKRHAVLVDLAQTRRAT